jgi:hypothetical protein
MPQRVDSAAEPEVDRARQDLGRFRVFDGMSDDLLQRCDWKRIGDFEVDTACSCLYAQILGLELRDVVGAVGL